jgi:putative acyl-CoA dehydrogenase
MTLAPQPVRNNLVEDLTGVDAFSHDKIAAAAIDGYAPWSRAHAEALGLLVWAPATLAAARNAHWYLPELRTHDRLGNRIDVVDFHPSYHELLDAQPASPPVMP